MKREIEVNVSNVNEPQRNFEARIQYAPSRYLVAYGRTENEATRRLLASMEREQDRREHEADKMAQLIAFNS